MLPTELLGEIFITVVALLKKTADITYRVPSVLVNTIDIHHPLALSQTCHRWRDVALDMPELWMALSNTVVDRQNKPTQVDRHLFRLFLARSKQLPLSVFLMADARAANKLAPHMDRVRSLELVDFPDLCKLEPLVRPASALEYLLLTSPPSSSVFNTREPMRQAPVLFSGSAPSLRALALFHPAFLPRQPFPMLTDLHIGGMSKPRLQDIFALLRGSLALESLAITDLRIPVNFWLFAGQPQLTPTIPLARLRRLALVQTPITHGMALLRHLAVPREATLDLLELFADTGNVGPVAIVPPQLPPVSAANALEMVVCGGALAFRTRVLAADGSVASVPRAHCTARWGAHAYSWWKGLWQTLPCAQLTELRVAVDADDDEILPRFLDAAIALTILELRLHPRDRDRGASWGEGGEDASTCLDGAPRALRGVCALLEQELPVVCPCLAELALIDAVSSPNAWDAFLSGEDMFKPRVAYVPDILCVIAARAAAGRRLRRVALQGLWSRTQRDRLWSAFGMGAVVTDLEFRELDADTSSLFEFEEHGEEIWVNRHWTYELPKSTFPWAPANGSRRGVHASVVKVLEIC